jgi:hypothetical protein
MQISAVMGGELCPGNRYEFDRNFASRAVNDIFRVWRLEAASAGPAA